MSENINEKNVKAKHRFNIVDFLIIVVVLACIVGVALRYNLVDEITVNTQKDTVKITFLVQNVWPYLADSFASGDELYISSLSQKIGKLADWNVTPAIVYYEMQNGTVTANYSEARVDMTGVVEAKGIMTENGFMLGGTTYVAAGKNMLIRNSASEIYVTIISVEQAG